MKAPDEAGTTSFLTGAQAADALKKGWSFAPNPDAGAAQQHKIAQEIEKSAKNSKALISVLHGIDQGAALGFGNWYTDIALGPWIGADSVRNKRKLTMEAVEENPRLHGAATFASSLVALTPTKGVLGVSRGFGAGGLGLSKNVALNASKEAGAAREALRALQAAPVPKESAALLARAQQIASAAETLKSYEATAQGASGLGGHLYQGLAQWSGQPTGAAIRAWETANTTHPSWVRSLAADAAVKGLQGLKDLPAPVMGAFSYAPEGAIYAAAPEAFRKSEQAEFGTLPGERKATWLTVAGQAALGGVAGGAMGGVIGKLQGKSVIPAQRWRGEVPVTPTEEYTAKELDAIFSAEHAPIPHHVPTKQALKDRLKVLEEARKDTASIGGPTRQWVDEQTNLVKRQMEQVDALEQYKQAHPDFVRDIEGLAARDKVDEATAWKAMEMADRPSTMNRDQALAMAELSSIGRGTGLAKARYNLVTRLSDLLLEENRYSLRRATDTLRRIVSRPDPVPLKDIRTLQTQSSLARSLAGETHKGAQIFRDLKTLAQINPGDKPRFVFAPAPANGDSIETLIGKYNYAVKNSNIGEGVIEDYLSRVGADASLNKGMTAYLRDRITRQLQYEKDHLLSRIIAKQKKLHPELDDQQIQEIIKQIYADAGEDVAEDINSWIRNRAEGGLSGEDLDAVTTGRARQQETKAIHELSETDKGMLLKRLSVGEANYNTMADLLMRQATVADNIADRIMPRRFMD
jgi:hypothetical protein